MTDVAQATLEHKILAGMTFLYGQAAARRRPCYRLQTGERDASAAVAAGWVF
jgi:hypothetical protein